MNDITAIIAEDEKTLRIQLRSLLQKAWPELRIVGEAANGTEALALISTHSPSVAFLDIRMPGLSGLAVAQNMAKRCRVVFVTAYDQYAVEAFEQAAVDYLLKPVSPERLSKTVIRLKKALAEPSAATDPDLKKMERLLMQLNEHQSPSPLQWVRVQQGDTLHFLSVGEICYFKSSDKYTVVRTESNEYLIRKPIKHLIQELDPQQFWQIHRGTVVNLSFIAGVSRSFTGKGVLRLKNLEETLSVSQTYMHLFRQM